MSLLIHLPEGQEFSEIYVLGSDQSFEGIPFNIRAETPYSVNLVIGNALGHSSYYTCYIKIANDTAAMPNTNLGSPSNEPALYEYELFVKDGETLQLPLTFQFDNLAFSDKTCWLYGIRINDVDISIDKSSAWSPTTEGFYYSLIAELWIFNSTLGVSQFNNRFISVPLNMAQ